jgi:K+ transporter
MSTDVAWASAAPDTGPSPGGGAQAALALCALGVVFGDLGTSPLYTSARQLKLAASTRPTVLRYALSHVPD